MAGGGKIGEKRPNRIQIFCSDSWTQENLRPKIFGKTNMFIFKAVRTDSELSCSERFGFESAAWFKGR